MSYVRGQDRMVYQTVWAYLVAQLTTLEWIGAGPYPYAATAPVTLLEEIPDVKAQVAPNSVAFTTGTDNDDEPAECGAASGGLFTTEHVFFIDVWGESTGVTRALASDIKAMLTGKLSGTSRYQNLIDFSQTPNQVLADHVLHFEDVVLETPMNQDYKRHWRVVKTRVIHEFNATEYGNY